MTVVLRAQSANAYVRVRQVWAWAARSPRRLHAFVLAGQLGPAYQPKSY